MFLELAQKRYSVRDYQDKKIDKDKLINVLEAGRLSPTAVNKQPFTYIVVSKGEEKKIVMDSYRRDWIRSAPTVIVVCLDHSISWKRFDGKDHGDLDGGIVIANMTLAATNEGLGTCIVCNFDSEKLRENLDLPAHLEIIALLPIGYPKTKEIPNKKRNSFDDIVTWIE